MFIQTQSAPCKVGFIVLFVLLLCESALGKDAATDEGDTGVGDSEHEPHAAHSILYMPLILTVGVILHYILSRKFHWLPYSAVMFLVGVIVGLLPEEFYRVIEDKTNVAHMYDTSQAWQNIDSEVLLLVFLPGLIFKDALSQNPFLFAKGFGQLFIFAFPMVLAGTFLIACVGFYIFNYNWSFFLCLTFGSILSATDPVAVAALLEEVGAPPRLKTHIAGESLLNDGAAIVFFSIFSDLFLSNLEIPGVGKVIGGAEGAKIFCKKALGGSAIGFVAGGAIVFLLFLLNRRYSREENIVQVLAVFSMVYLNYYVAEAVCHTSGVIATLCAGLFVKFFGRGEINDIHLMDDFFSIIEHILNTIIFSLGGLVWGEFLYKNIDDGIVTWIDLGNLIILYVLLHVIRGFLFASCYPITANIGLGTNWRETSFQIYGGLRGAVGIALAIALDNEVKMLRSDENYDVEKEYEDVSKMYFMVGGIAFLTLFVNGATAGPLLKRLRLVEHSEGRQKIIDAYRCHLREITILSFVKYLTHERFKSVNFSAVQENIPFLQDLTLDQLVDAVQKVKETTDPNTYRPPYLENVLLALKVGDSEIEQYDILLETPEQYTKNRRMQKQNAIRMLRHRSSMRLMMKSDQLSAKELRLLFISMLKAQHENLINEGLLLSENGLTIALNQSLELATTDVTNDMKLNDLKHAKDSYEMISKFTRFTEKITDFFRCGQKRSDGQNQNRSSILLEFAFTASHERAQRFFTEQLGDGDKELTEAAKIVLAESKEEVEEITNDLTCDKRKKIYTDVSTRKFCNALLNQGIVYVEELVENGLLKESEAEEIIHELSHYQAITVERKIEPLEAEESV
jgi:NhaP-type Na+/H+ or K+/H+ antiporter